MSLSGRRPVRTAAGPAKEIGHTRPTATGATPGVTVKGFADNDANNADLSVPKNPGLSAAVIMMLSSAGKRGDAARCATWGFSFYLTKPIGQAELLETAVQALDGRDAGRRFLITQK